MKRLLYTILAIIPFGVQAQTMYDIAPVMENSLVGTSRFVSMGGSMGALGGDVSVMGTNPAGIALYRRNDIALTASVNFLNTNSSYNGLEVKSKKNVFDVNNFGAVFTNKISDEGTLRFLNLAVGYRRTGLLTNEFSMNGPSGGFSQQYAIMDLYNNNPFELDNINRSSFEDFEYSWLPMMMTYANVGDAGGNLIMNNGGLIFEPTDVYYYSDKSGGVSEVDFNLSTNVSDYLYLGATMSIANVNYEQSALYCEDDEQGEIYSIGNYTYLDGAGFNLKLGAIVRPFVYSPFRFGVYLHTPTWYQLRTLSWADIEGPYGDFYETKDKDLYGAELLTNAAVTTPWRIGVSAAYTFGSHVALNAEYEYVDYSTAEYEWDGTTFDSAAQNEEIACNLKEQHTVRVGVEYNVDNNFSLRAGYNYASAPFRKGAYKEMLNMPVSSTSTEYTNLFDKHTITFGTGFRGKYFYFDLAYVFQTRNADFYPYFDPEVPNPAAKVNYDNHSVMATMGFKF